MSTGSPSCPGCVCTYPPWCHPCRRQDSALAMANCPGRSTLARILRCQMPKIQVSLLKCHLVGAITIYNQHLELSGASLRSYVPFRPTLFNNDQMQLWGRWPLNHLVCPAQYHDGYWYSHSVPSPSTYLKTMGFKWPNKGWKQETFWKRICQMLHQNHSESNKMLPDQMRIQCINLWCMLYMPIPSPRTAKSNAI